GEGNAAWLSRSECVNQAPRMEIHAAGGVEVVAVRGHGPADGDAGQVRRGHFRGRALPEAQSPQPQLSPAEEEPQQDPPRCCGQFEIDRTTAVIGKLSAAMLAKLNDCLKAVLYIS